MSPLDSIPSLVDEMNAIVGRCTSSRERIHGALDAVARFLPTAPQTELADLPPGDSKYSRHLVHRDPKDRFSLLALVWRPGQGTPIHDHPSWGVLGVVSGRMRFVNYGVDEVKGHRCLVPVETFLCTAGSVGTVFPPHVDIHRMENGSDEEMAITLHCYGCEVKEFYIYTAETAERRVTSATYDSELNLSGVG